MPVISRGIDIGDIYQRNAIHFPLFLFQTLSYSEFSGGESVYVYIYSNRIASYMYNFRKRIRNNNLWCVWYS